MLIPYTHAEEQFSMGKERGRNKWWLNQLSGSYGLELRGQPDVFQTTWAPLEQMEIAALKVQLKLTLAWIQMGPWAGSLYPAGERRVPDREDQARKHSRGQVLWNLQAPLNLSYTSLSNSWAANKLTWQAQIMWLNPGNTLSND